MSRGNRIALACIYWAFVLYVFVPLILMILMGFKDSKFIGFPIRSWTLDWYTRIFSDAEVIQTFVVRSDEPFDAQVLARQVVEFSLSGVAPEA